MKRLPQWAHRLFILGCLLFIFGMALATTDTPTGLSAQPVAAQGGEGQEPTDKVDAIDFYPDPLAAGALAFSLRDPWDHTDLTYFFHNCPSRQDCEQAQNVVRQAFNTWAGVSALTFREVASPQEADIEVQWVEGQTGRTDPLEELGEMGGTLAYAFFPRYGGDMFIDDSEPWTIGDGGSFDLVVTATHEIGHAIGLGHSEFTTAIMYPYSGNASQLGADDLAAIQSLYGPPSGTTPTTTDANNNTPPTTTDRNDTDDTDVNIIPADSVFESEGTITNSDPFDVWDLTVTAGEIVTITMTSTTVDAYLGVLTEDFSIALVENDDFADTTNSQVVYTFEEGGTYKVVATRFGFEGGDSSGSYQLRVERSTGGTPDVVDEPSGDVVFRVTNFADTELCYIYFSSSDSDTWGVDQLGEDQVLNDDFYLEWQVPPGTYDVQVWDCFGNKLERYNIPTSRGIDVQVFFDSIEVVPLQTVPAAPEAPTTVIWRVTNYADTPLCAVYFSTTDDENWGPNQLGEQLQNNYYLEWELEVNVYDIRVEDCGEGFLEEYQITVRGNVDVQIYADMILVVPLR